jgi:putative two-component system response regulator
MGEESQNGASGSPPANAPATIDLQAVLIVDDEINILRSLKRLLRNEKYLVRLASTPEEGLAQIGAEPPAVVISDYIMPDRNGLDFLNQVRTVCPDAIRVILSGYADLGAIIQALNNGEIYHYITKPWEDELLKIEIRKFLDQWALLKRQREMDRTLEIHLNSAVEVLSALPKIKDPGVAEEGDRVWRLCSSIGSDYPLSKEELKELEVAAKLHNIGNIGVPSLILNKPGKLTPEEKRAVEMHVVIPQIALQPMKIFDASCRIIRHHHEFYDGSGYPDHLKGGEIPVASRILCAVEAFDAFLSDRPHRKAVSMEEAIIMLQQASNSLYDPGVVRLLVQQVASLRIEGFSKIR